MRGKIAALDAAATASAADDSVVKILYLRRYRFLPDARHKTAMPSRLAKSDALYLKIFP